MNRKIDYGVYVLSLTMALASCRNDSGADVKQKIISEHFKLLNEHNLEALSKQYADSAKVTSPEISGIGSKDSIINVYWLCFNYCADTKFKIERTIEKENTIVVEYEVSGTLTRNDPPPAPNIYPNGIHLKKCTIFKIDEGKITTESTYSNSNIYAK